jgi:hypothetical protein
MAPDYRSDPMATPEGKGRARKIWDAYAKAVNKTITPSVAPFLDPITQPVGRQLVEDLIGFWVLWHLYGGFEGLERFGMHQSTIWRKVKRFREIVGVHPDEYEMPGISIDPRAYWESDIKKIGNPPHS